MGRNLYKGQSWYGLGGTNCNYLIQNTDQIYINNYHNQKIKINVGVLLPSVTRTSILASWNSNHLYHVPEWYLIFCLLSICWEDSVERECLNMAFPPHAQYLWHHITTWLWYNKEAYTLHLMQIWGQPYRWNGPVSYISEHIKDAIAISGHFIHNACCCSTFNHSTTTEYSLTTH